MQVANIDSISAFKHAWVTGHNVTLAESVVLKQSAYGGGTMLAGAIELGEVSVNGI